MFVSIVMATDDSARFPAASVARITTVCAPSARCNLAVGSVPSRVQPPPSTATSKRSTPEPESEADQVRVTSWLVECPGVWTAASAGGVSSTRTVNVWAGSSQPALSVAVNWIVWTPELKVNGSPYGRQVPVPTR